MIRFLEVLVLLFLYLGLPVAVSRLLTRANCREIANAYCIWLVILLIGGASMGNTIGEKLGWPMIFAMFYTTLAIPMMIWIFRLVGFRLRWFTD